MPWMLWLLLALSVFTLAHIVYQLYQITRKTAAYRSYRETSEKLFEMLWFANGEEPILRILPQCITADRNLEHVCGEKGQLETLAKEYIRFLKLLGEMDAVSPEQAAALRQMMRKIGEKMRVGDQPETIVAFAKEESQAIKLLRKAPPTIH